MANKQQMLSVISKAEVDYFSKLDVKYEPLANSFGTSHGIDWDTMVKFYNLLKNGNCKIGHDMVDGVAVMYVI